MQTKVLVTGGNGFLAENIIKNLLTQGYQVRATLRCLEKQAAVEATMNANHVPNTGQLSFMQADLTKAADWTRAMQGVTYVMSVAAPVFVNGEQVDSDITNAAKAGILQILQAAEAAQVKRVVMTGNLGAVGFSVLNSDRPVTEADWTKVDQPGLSAYEKSKLVAELAAWQYLRNSKSQLEFATVNAGAMLGPSLDDHVSGSFGLVRQLLDGKLKRVPNLGVNVVDVRDVADMHVRAMQNPAAANQRFLAVADDSITLPEISQLIRQKRPQLANKLATKRLPDWLLHVAGRFNQQAKEANLMLQLDHHVSNQKAREVLGWQPISTASQAVLAAVDTLQRIHQI